ncbi:MAG: response regulator transcription factor [Acidimicrobiales bacterium]
MTRLVLVEDDADIATPLRRALEREGYEVVVRVDGVTGLAACLDPATAIVVLDINLPDIDGIEVCERLRQERPTLPVIFLTARAEEVDLVVGLDAGADDYVTKPFKLAELTARIRARLRPTAVVADDGAASDEVRGVRIDKGAHRAFHGVEELELSVKEFDLLALLVEEAGRVVPRKEIMSRVWNEHWYGPTRTLDMHISWLRRKLGDDPNGPTMITTVRGVGFRFERDQG